MVGDGWTPRPVFPQTSEFHFRILSLEKAGPAACRDAGARQARHDWLCFVDSDVLVHRDAFTLAASLLSDSGDDGLVGSYDDQPEDHGTVSRFRNLLHHFHHQRNAGMTGVFWGAFSMVRKSAYLDAGGFDPSYREASIEDIELGYRLSDKGYQITLRPEVQVTHLKRWTLTSMVRTDILLRAKPWTLLHHRYRDRHMGDLNTSLKERVSAAVSGLFLLSIPFTLLGVVPFLIPAMAILLFLILQYGICAFMLQMHRVVDWPWVFLLHHVYFLSAMSGWLLARIQLIREQ